MPHLIQRKALWEDKGALTDLDLAMSTFGTRTLLGVKKQTDEICVIDQT